MAGKSASLSINIIADAAKAKAGLREAETAFGKFRTQVGQAQGAMGKFQAGAGAAFSFVKSNALAFGATAGAAVMAFAGKSVMAFQDLALGAGRFADATGLAVEDASRFIEVAGDIGIEAGTVEKALGFMNKTLGNSPELFKQLGVQIEYAKNGSTDVAGTFLNVVDRLNGISDPAQRAAAATKLLGRGWMELSELIGKGSDEIAASLAAVSEGKVIDEEERKRAEDFRAALDDLKDSGEDLALALGETLVPVLSDLARATVGLVDGLKTVHGWLKIGSNDFAEVAAEAKFLTDAWKEGYRAQIDAASASAKLQVEMELQAAAVEAARLEWDAFRNGLTIQGESIRITQNIEDFRTKWAGATDEMKRKSREYQLELLAIQTQLSNSALSIVGLATTAQNTRIRLLIETGRLEQALSLINAIRAGMNQLAGAITPDRVDRITGQFVPPVSTPRTTAPKPPAQSPLQQIKKIPTTRLPAMAQGGTVVGAGLALVGERGPELLSLPSGASVTPNIPRRVDGGGSQMIVNIEVQAGLVSSPDEVGAQIIDAIRRAERRSGQVFAAV